MEYQQNLNGHFKKSRFRFFIGILFFLFTVFLIQHRISSGQGFRVWDWIGIVIFLLNGLYHLTGGMGYALENFLGRKSYILIDEEQIHIKTVSKARQVYWTEIATIAYQSGYLRITKKDNRTDLIMVSGVDTSYLFSILAILREFATNKNIRFVG
jgi:hypothetical protein